MLTTQQIVKDYLKLQGSSTVDEAEIERLIKATSTEIETYCDRLFNIPTTNLTEYISANGSDTIFPRNTPIISVDSLYDDKCRDYDEDSLINSEDYNIFDDCIVLKNSIFSDGFRNIRLTYSYGYTTIPEDIQHVCTVETARKFRFKDSVGISSKASPDGSSLVFIEGYLKESRRVLNKYKNVSLI